MLPVRVKKSVQTQMAITPAPVAITMKESLKMADVLVKKFYKILVKILLLNNYRY